MEKFLADQKDMEERRKMLIDELLRAKAAAIKDFDDKLAKLGYQPDGTKSRRSHHKKSAPAGTAKNQKG
ncbi:MAG TPA: hypothetical protein VGQ49_11290 [Bryobacteraceae bacterium]|nr:hypothetical protein [Bryobacteraceae bacterium]